MTSKEMPKYYLILLALMVKYIEVLSSEKHVVRCTRRYTAGYCEENVKPMWTFEFQKQDCIMRMGCPSSPRVNRFRKYSHCMRRCKVLVDVYTQILLNNTAARDGSWGSPRRDIDGTSYLRSDIADSTDLEVYEDNAPDVPSYDSDNVDSLGDVIPSNIDGDIEIHSFLDMLNDNI